ncbi:MAG: HNH endonuclease [Candidatus Eisenbacteria bacterium]|uniref:HNH endonuclease n=1 Tax=Eiseniibacteriota bacterium TaxID=2212470 RepID=A0A948RY78_UNCEI|nr:HNH endonuclease [Candidatus Eisenbacteria bacterium]
METAKGYIALTDPGWYSFLSTRERLDEVNFWQPRGGRNFRSLNRGEPFYFKLRAPYKAIAGFGFFERFERLPAWMAWECFKESNGADSFDAMLDQIIPLRGDQGSLENAGEFEIGCIMIAAPIFFDQKDWVSPPNDWAKTGIQQGKRYDLGSGEGRRIFDECLARAQSGERYWNIETPIQIVGSDKPRYGSPISIRPRYGQGLFSRAVREAYGGACAVTSEHSDPVLEAAHIRPYRLGGEHRVDNGILLRRDLHRLYDHGYVTITENYTFRVGDCLRDEFKNGRSYYGLNGFPILVPSMENLRPQRELLEWHNTEIFKG